MHARAWARLLAGATGAGLATVAMAQAERDLERRLAPDTLYPTPVVIYGLLSVGGAKTEGEAFLVKGTERSRLGLRATEILDRGLLAYMQLEQSINMDHGSLRKPDKAFDARMSVGLGERDWGRIDIGRMEQAASMLVFRADPWGGNAGVGPGGDLLYTVSPDADTRSSGMVAYSSSTSWPVRVVLQVNGPAPADAEVRGHGASLAWDRLPWLAGVGFQRTIDGARNVPVVLSHDDGTRKVSVAWTDGRSERKGASGVLPYKNLFIGMSVRGMGKGDPERHEWRAGLDRHRVEGDVDGALGSGSKISLGWRYNLSRRVWTDLGAAWFNPINGPSRSGLEASLSYSFDRDLRVPQRLR